ncbi:hypothetical protein LWI28_023215 [Acer negundo]|uniref:Uncharacterized protein n=1 Tax=Acer negundo TaxID=4023 RepID=A0AAD5ISB2_ACENE|nr:hypothetical protein LWI28_023215 [Acer negundo]
MDSNQNGDLKRSNSKINGNVPESTVNSNSEAEAKQRALSVEWLNSIFPHLNLTIKASDEELRTCLIGGTVLCQILKSLKLVPVDEADDADSSSENVTSFLATLDKLGIPRFEISDIEKGSMKPVVDCLLTLRGHSMPNGDNFSNTDTVTKSASLLGDASNTSPLFGEEKRKALPESQFKRTLTLRNSVIPDPSAALIQHAGHKFHEVFQLKQGRYSDLPAAKISEMMKSNSLDNAPTQSLLSVVNGILDESVEKKSGEIPHRVACLLRKVVQEIERRISTQAEHLRTQNNLFKTREEKYQSRIRVLETLAAGSGEETEIVMQQLQQMKAVKSKVEEKKKVEDEDLVKLMKEKDQHNLEISGLKQELEMAKKTNEGELVKLLKEKDQHNLEISGLKQESEMAKKTYEGELVKLLKEKDHHNLEISGLKQELEMAKKTYELRCLQMETESKGAAANLVDRLKELESLLTDSRNKVKELERNSESKFEGWSKKENIYQSFLDFQLGALRELRFSSDSIKQEISKARKIYSDEFHCIGKMVTFLGDAAENYTAVLAENRKLFNEVQDLRGNIRVYCRVRPFLPGQTKKQSTIEYIGENGEMIVANPAKTGKEGHRMFKFNKIFGPASTQAEVFSDTKPLIRSVLDGFNVCIFAYGQTGSGKTHTMSGPEGASEEDWGVNYRALNDLFTISQTRRSSIIATSDVVGLMDIGLKNRSIGSTALNERSSRSHSVVTIHVRGKDLKTGVPMHGNLHLVDLAGSERVDRSEVTGDRLKEAQHINKSLSALGDVIFALAQKSPHVPYRNSKLTQVLQSSLGGQAKTLMFVQLNPDSNSFSESLSTLKFAERVSGVELGAAKSSKEGRDVKELMEQVASLKDTISKKDDEIERLQLLKDLKNVYPGVNGEKRGSNSSRPKPASRISRHLPKSGPVSASKDLRKVSTGVKRTVTGNSTLVKPPPRRFL